MSIVAIINLPAGALLACGFRCPYLANNRNVGIAYAAFITSCAVLDVGALV